jgi:hypothetical protein
MDVYISQLIVKQISSTHTVFFPEGLHHASVFFDKPYRWNNRNNSANVPAGKFIMMDHFPE